MTRNDAIDLFNATPEDLDAIKYLFTTYVEPSADLVDKLDPYAAAIRGVSSLWESLNRARFKKYHEAYWKEVSKEGDEIKREAKVNEFKKRLEKESNLGFILEALRSAVQKNSTYSSIVLGTMTGMIVRNQKEVSAEDLILLQAIEEINDFELRTVIHFFERIQNRFSQLDDTTMQSITFSQVYSHEILEENPILMITIRKLLRSQIIVPHENHAAPQTVFCINRITRYYFELIKVSGIIEPIKKELLLDFN